MKDFRLRNIAFTEKPGTDRLYSKAFFEAGKRTILGYVITTGSKYSVYSTDHEYLGTGKYTNGALAIFRLFSGHNTGA